MEDGFTKRHTLYCKGIAVSLMVIHHLFWNIPDIGVKINGIALSQRVGIIGKVCVAIFLLLSGIGIYKSNRDNFSIKQFYSKSILKIYSNYIFIVILSTIIGIIFFKDKFNNMTIDGIKGVIYYLLTCSGFQYIIGYQGFNGAWWFVTVILICYICYPVIRKLVQKDSYKFIVLSFVLSLLDAISLGRIKVFNIVAWMFIFNLGVFITHNNILFKVKEYVNKVRIRRIIMIIILFGLLIIRQEIPPQGFISIKLEYILSLLIVLTIYVYYERFKYSRKIIEFLGKYSMNIFYVHMFFTTYYLKEFTYSLKNPIVIFLFVISISLLCSISIEKFKNFIKYEVIINKINAKLNYILPNF